LANEKSGIEDMYISGPIKEIVGCFFKILAYKKSLELLL
jgi:hypothetical protein